MVNFVEELGLVLRWMLFEFELEEGKNIWLCFEYFFVDEILVGVNLKCLYV